MKSKKLLMLLILIIGIASLTGCITVEVPRDNDKTPEEELSETVPQLEVELGEKAKIDASVLQDMYDGELDIIAMINQFVGYDAPDFTVEDIDGKDVSLKDYSGSGVILEFMGTWCPVCESVAPSIEAYNNQDPEAKIVSIAVDSPAKEVKQYLEDHEITNTQYLIADEDIIQDYGIRFVPVFFFVDRDNVVQMILVGDVSVEMLQSYAEISLGE